MLSTPKYRPLGEFTSQQGPSFADMLDYAPNAPPRTEAEQTDEKGRDELTLDEDMPREKATNHVVPTIETSFKKQQTRIQHGDPRFLGKINRAEVQRNYAFIGDLRKEELKEFETAYKALSEETPAEEREALKKKINALKKKIGEMNRRLAESEIREALVQAELRAIAHGKKAFFLKDREIKRITSESLYCNDIKARKETRKLQKAYKRYVPLKI